MKWGDNKRDFDHLAVFGPQNVLFIVVTDLSVPLARKSDNTPFWRTQHSAETSNQSMGPRCSPRPNITSLAQITPSDLTMR